MTFIKMDYNVNNFYHLYHYKDNSVQKELLIKDDYRIKNLDKSQRIFYPLNENTSFKINQSFHEFTKDKKKEKKIITTKGRDFELKIFMMVFQDLNLKNYVM